MKRMYIKNMDLTLDYVVLKYTSLVREICNINEEYKLIGENLTKQFLIGLKDLTTEQEISDYYDESVIKLEDTFLIF